MRLANLVLLLAWLLPACAVAERGLGTLIVASDLDNLPFAGVAADGVPIGRDVEMMQLLAERTGAALEWRRVPFAELLGMVEAGEVDVVCATLGITPERERRVLFSEPYFVTTIAAVVRVGAGEPTTLVELANRRVSAARGTTSERAVRRLLSDATLVSETDNDPPAFDRLSARDIDAAVMDGPAATALVAGSNGRLQRIATALAAEHYALALPKDRGGLCEALNQALRELQSSGALARLNRRHGLSGN